MHGEALQRRAVRTYTHAHTHTHAYTYIYTYIHSYMIGVIIKGLAPGGPAAKSGQIREGDAIVEVLCTYIYTYMHA